MQDSKRHEFKSPQHAANDNRPAGTVMLTSRSPESQTLDVVWATVIVLGVVGLIIASSVLGIGTAEVFIRWL